MRETPGKSVGGAPMNRPARPWLAPLSIAAIIAGLLAPAVALSAESDEGFFSRLLGRGKSETSSEAGKTEQTLDCPEVQVPSGESSLRVGGEGSTSVRHQFSVGDVARECAVVGNQLTIKVGVKGRLLIGPAGSAGSYSAPLRIGIRKTLGEQVLVSKVFNVGGMISSVALCAVIIHDNEPL